MKQAERDKHMPAVYEALGEFLPDEFVLHVGGRLGDAIFGPAGDSVGGPSLSERLERAKDALAMVAEYLRQMEARRKDKLASGGGEGPGTPVGESVGPWPRASTSGDQRSHTRGSGEPRSVT